MLKKSSEIYKIAQKFKKEKFKNLKKKSSEIEKRKVQKLKKEKFRNLKNYEKQGPYIMLYFPLILYVSLDTMKINECLEDSLNHKQSRSIELN